jgi:prolyl-tRNA synthetase
MSNKGITKREDNYSKWYLDVVEQADLAENSAVRGAMVIKPHGYAIWENIQKNLDRMIKEHGVVNAYFPLLIPKSFLSREASHVKGFAKECAVVTHHRLMDDGKGGVVVDPDSKLEEELIIRPTSETVMYDTFSRWITSWRDLPLQINQWANVMRWEMRTRPFLRTSEFLWQEGHTVHETEKEAVDEAMWALNMYKTFAEKYLAMPVLTGKKSEMEKFAGALDTYGVEALMQDGKALQFGTSHNLGQNFAKAFNIMFTDRDGKQQYSWQTSWGVSTRMMGALIMIHGDDKGLVLPPNISPIKSVIIPIYSDKDKNTVLQYAQKVMQDLKSVKLDDRENLSPGVKFNEWEKKGIPVRIEIGPKDMSKKGVTLVRRDTGEKEFIKLRKLSKEVNRVLEDIQNSLYNNALSRLEENTHTVETYDEFKDIIKNKKGFVKAHWCGDPKCEEQIKYDTKATTRCLTDDGVGKKGKCIVCGKECNDEWTFAVVY